MKYPLSVACMFAVLLTGVLSAGPSVKSPKPLNQREYRFLALCTLQSEQPDWLWTESDRSIRTGKHRFGTYLGGAQAIRWSSLPDCMYGYLGLADAKPEYRDRLAGLALLTGLPVYAKNQGSQEFSDEINYYNPAMITALRLFFIPSPAIMFSRDKNFQDLYDTMFKRNARILAQTYRELQTGNEFEKYLKDYKTRNGTGRIAFKYEVFQNVSYEDDLASDENDEYGYYFDAGHAAAFWMRRGLDETHDEVFSLLLAVFKKYDPEFFNKLKAN